MRSFMMFILGVFLLTGTAFCGGGEQCSHGKGGDYAATLMEASKALETSNPELAAKVKTIADDCCKLGLHESK